MCDAGRIRRHLKRLLWRSEVTVLIASGPPRLLPGKAAPLDWHNQRADLFARDQQSLGYDPAAPPEAPWPRVGRGI